MHKTFETLNNVANKVSGSHTRKSMALQAILVLLVALRIAYALWAVIHLSFTSLLWSLVVLSVLFLGLTATRSRQRFLLLIYIAAMCVVMALTTLGLFLVLLGEVLTLSVDLFEIIVDGSSLILELVTIALAYNLYLHLDPSNNVTLDELGSEGGQVYPDENSINIDLQDSFQAGDMSKLSQEPTSPYALNPHYAGAMMQPVMMQPQPNSVYSPYVYPMAGSGLTQAETMPQADVNPFQEPPK